MTRMTRAEFDAATLRNKLPITPETSDELYIAFGKIESMADRVNCPKPREIEPALIFVVGASR